MVSIILQASEEAKEKALKAGFKESTVLIRHDPIASTEENRHALETEVSGFYPYQFLVSDYWGMCNPD